MKKHFLLKRRRSLIRSEWLFFASSVASTGCWAAKYWVNLKDFSKHKIELSSLKGCFVLVGFPTCEFTM